MEDITAEQKIPTKSQPTHDDYKLAILLTPGPVLTLRSFKQSVSHRLRGIILQEFHTILENFVTKELGIIPLHEIVRITKRQQSFHQEKIRKYPRGYEKMSS